MPGAAGRDSRVLCRPPRYWSLQRAPNHLAPRNVHMGGGMFHRKGAL